MSEPALITLVGVPGDACEGDDCLPVPPPAEPDPPHDDSP